MLLQRLIDIQKSAGLSDRKFAQLLGVHDSLWTYTRQGRAPIRFQVLRGAVQAFPDNELLHKDVIIYLATTHQTEPPF